MKNLFYGLALVAFIGCFTGCNKDDDDYTAQTVQQQHEQGYVAIKKEDVEVPPIP